MPELEIALSASYCRLRGGGGPRSGGGIRGVVSGFSRASRKRMLDLLNMIKRENRVDALFIGLTYPDSFPEQPEVWKRHLDTFFKRLRRRYPRASLVWRLEFAERLSGENKGKTAPHFHGLLFNTPVLDVQWLSQAWYETVGSGDFRHYRAGTSAQRVRSWRAVGWYASKYMSKPQEAFEGHTGRCWGILGRRHLGIVLVQVQLSWAQFYKMRRVMRGLLRRRYSRRRKDSYKWVRHRGQGMSLYVDDETSGRLVSWALAQ